MMSMVACNHPQRHGNKAADKNEQCVEKSQSRPYIKMYVENSASMDGYVSGGSDLCDLVQGYLYNTSELSPRGLSCYFINNQIIHIGSDIEEYIKKITPAQFKKEGGNRGSSDLADIFKQIIPKGDTVAILVSDCIFSPGQKRDASEYVTRQYNQIKHLFHEFALNNNTSILIYRFVGKFNGTYYDCKDNPSKYNNGVRPFFLIVIGKDEHIQKLRTIENKLTETVKIQNKCIITHNTPNINYAVLPSSGYRVDRENNHAIENAKLSKGKGSQQCKEKTLTISVGIDLRNLIANEQYILDASNWQTDNPSYKVISINKTEKGKHSHKLKIETTSNNKASVDIALMNKMPNWVYRFNDDDCGAASPDDAIQTTFGLRKMIQGMFDAFTDNANYLCKFTISINQ